MQIKKKRYGYKQSSNYKVIVLFLFVFMGLGCASTHKTTKTETTTTYSTGTQEQKVLDNEGYIIRRQNQVIPVTDTTSTTTTTTETKPEEHPGVISSTFHAIGYVIALPFIIIGGLFRIIFGG